MPSPDLVAALRQVPAFAGLPEPQLQWLASHSEVVHFQAGDLLFKKGDPVDYMLVILEGKTRFQTDLNGQGRSFGGLEKGSITGVLPYSRLKTAGGYGVALEPTTVMRMHRDHLPEMEKVAPEMVKVLVEVMTTRVREYTSFQQQNEKMLALGKLSAGLAHELNNPASAMVRSASELKRRLRAVPERFKHVLYARMTPEAVDAVTDLLGRLAQPVAWASLSPLERSDKEEELAAWLERRGVEDGSLYAATFLESGLGADSLEIMAGRVPPPALSALVGWLENSLASEKLVQDIEEAARRISSLVQSVKAYSHMDQAPDRRPLDLASDLRSTLTMLGHKVRAKNIAVKLHLPPGLPKIPGWADELNQVWTNLIDNALDAMDRGGRLEISAAVEEGCLVVRVVDDGPGIPAEIRSRIFDPFFTTKAAGHGTGLGLDIVRRIVEHHEAEIRVDSHPGRTEFSLWFKLEAGN
jgi:signal transduction histidine kinase